MNIKKDTKGKWLWRMFLAMMILILTVFVVRVNTGSVVTEASDGQIMKLANQYVMGKVYDRNGELIVNGSESGNVWCGGEETKLAFSELIRTDIAETLNSKMTIAGMSPWLFGLEDNKFEWEDFRNPWKPREGGNIRLTLDKQLQLYVSEMIQNQSYENVYVVVSNWKTGEVYAAVGPVFSGMSHVGSTMKPILAAAAMEIDPELRNFTYDCVEKNHVFQTEEGPYHIACYNDSYHGLVDMESAIAKSCNGYFVALMQQMPKKKLKAELLKWGFDTSVAYEQFIYWDNDLLNGSEEEIDYLFAGIGQGNTKMTALGLHMCTSAILNQGTLQELFFVQAKSAESDGPLEVLTVDTQHKFCEAENAEAVRNMMVQVTANGTGRSFYLPGFAAKTGTATNPNGTNTVWTTGGLVSEKTPYCVTVGIDQVDDSVGSGVAGKMAKEILEYMMGGSTL